MAFPVDISTLQNDDGGADSVGILFRHPVLPGRSQWQVELAFMDPAAAFDPLGGPSPMPEQWTVLHVPFNEWEDPRDWATMGVLPPRLEDIPSGTRAYGGLRYWFYFTGWDFDFYTWPEFEAFMGRLVLRFTLMEWKLEPEDLRNTEPLDFSPLLQSPIPAIREKAMFAVTFDRASLD